MPTISHLPPIAKPSSTRLALNGSHLGGFGAFLHQSGTYRPLSFAYLLLSNTHKPLTMVYRPLSIAFQPLSMPIKLLSMASKPLSNTQHSLSRVPQPLSISTAAPVVALNSFVALLNSTAARLKIICPTLCGKMRAAISKNFSIYLNL